MITRKDCFGPAYELFKLNLYMEQTQAFHLVKKGASESAFELRSLTLPGLANDQVLIEVEAFGLNYADVMARLGLYREAPPMPCVIGYEVVGIVSQVANEADKELLGKRVVGCGGHDGVQ